MTMEIQSARLWALLSLIVAECCLVSVLVSMEVVQVPASNTTNSSNVPIKLCWSWSADSDGKDCPMDLLFTQVLLAGFGIFVCFVPALLQCLRQGNYIYQGTCVCPLSFCEAFSFFLPLFFSITCALLSLVFIGIVVEDNRVNSITPGIVDLSVEMIITKPWRMVLTSIGGFLILLACIFSGILAATWRGQGNDSSTGSLQSRTRLRSRGLGRNNLKQSLFVADL